MTLYELDERITALEQAENDDLHIDEETGEIMTIEQALDGLYMARAEKLENVACWAKNLDAEAAMLRMEEERLNARRKAKERRRDRRKSYLLGACMGPDGTPQKFETARCAVRFRRDEAVIIAAGDQLPEEYIRRKVTEEPDKVAIKAALKAGKDVPGAALETRRSVMIK